MHKKRNWHYLFPSGAEPNIIIIMNYGKEFRNYAVKHHGLGGIHVDKYMEQNGAYGMGVPNISNLNPTIVEERRMNAVIIDVFSRLMMDRIIFFGVQVTDYAANIVQAQLLFLESVDPSRDVNIYINSPGGSVTAGLGIYDTMQYIAPDIATICTGMAASMGAVLLSAGAKGKRTALQHSRVMIHQPLGGANGQTSDIEISYKLIKSMQKDLYNILAHHTGHPYEKIYEDCDRDYWMTSNEAKEYGIVDEVLSKNTTPATTEGEI